MLEAQICAYGLKTFSNILHAQVSLTPGISVNRLICAVMRSLVPPFHYSLPPDHGSTISLWVRPCDYAVLCRHQTPGLTFLRATLLPLLLATTSASQTPA